MRTKRRRPLRALVLLLAVGALALLWLHWQSWGLQTTFTQVEVDGLPDGFDGVRIVHLSDLHGHEYGEGSEELLRRVREAEPDYIFLTGDLIDREEQLPVIGPLARGLAAIAPTYYVTGNHEWAVGGVRELKALLKEWGVTVLANRYTVVEREGDELVIAGVDDPNGYADQKTPEELYGEIQRAYPGLFTLLLAHRNDSAQRYADAGYDLIFSGHAHGGIIRLPFTDGLLSPARTLFPTHTAGVYAVGEGTLFVSRGLGNNTDPIHGFRLFNRLEVAVVELKASSPEGS